MALSLSANAQGEAFPEGFIDKSLTEAEGYTEWIPEPPKFTGGELPMTSITTSGGVR